MDLNTTNEKAAIITSLEDLNAFITNNKKHINPDKLAALIVHTEKLEEKIKDIFSAEVKLNEVLEKYKLEVNNQQDLIAEQEKILARCQGEVASREPEDEYGGVIVRV